jgi:hypothetical protein
MRGLAPETPRINKWFEFQIGRSTAWVDTQPRVDARLGLDSLFIFVCVFFVNESKIYNLYSHVLQ